MPVDIFGRANNADIIINQNVLMLAIQNPFYGFWVIIAASNWLSIFLSEYSIK